MEKVQRQERRVNTTAASSFDRFEARRAFEDAMWHHGLHPGRSIVADGTPRTFKTDHAKGWYVYNETYDHSWGAYGNWRTGNKFKWSSWKAMRRDGGVRPNRGLTVDTTATQRADRDRHNRGRALNFWRFGRKNQNNPYLVRKQVWAHGTREHRGTTQIFRGVDTFGALMVRVDDDDERIQALQFILEDGTKRNLGPTKGGHYWVGTPERRQTLCIAEGFATAASVYEETRYPCCIAFGTSGFEHVARYVRHAFHPKPLIIVADGDDAGINAANGAARAVDALVFVCDDGLDFNDMMRRAK
jgi:putative DNA primase/helicase